MTELDPIGTLQDINSVCDVFSIDTSSDYLKDLIIGYNETGIYGISFLTYQNQKAAFGRRITDSSLLSQLWGITIYEDGP